MRDFPSSISDVEFLGLNLHLATLPPPISHGTYSQSTSTFCEIYGVCQDGFRRQRNWGLVGENTVEGKKLTYFY